METIKLWARHGDAVRQAIALGALVHLDPASAELTDAFLLLAIQRGRRLKWAAVFPDAFGNVLPGAARRAPDGYRPNTSLAFPRSRASS